jgi:hypothetical protein
MGMFDSIKCEYDLPVPDCIKDIDFKIIQDAEFQTKDFDSSLNVYTITKEGKLFLKKAEYKWVDDDNSFLKGYLDEVSSSQEDTNFHGEFNFYCFEYIQKDNKEINVCIDYIAKFTNGHLDNIRITNAEVKDTTGRKNTLDQLFKEQETINRLWYNKYFFRTKSVIKLRRYLYRSILSVQKSIDGIFYFLLRYL